MSHGAEHHLEHAEHAVHAASDDFNRVVTMSIAIIAAVLACVTMLGHRSHNETLRLQGDALQLQTLASIESTKMADKYSYYQTKNLVHDRAKTTLDLLKVVATAKDSQDDLRKIRAAHQKDIEKYEKKLPDTLEEAKAIGKKSDDFAAKADEKMKESHIEHKKAERLDYGELGLQFGVVLCSLAILTRSRSFWWGGLLSSALGAAVAATGQFGLLMGGHH